MKCYRIVGVLLLCMLYLGIGVYGCFQSSAQTGTTTSCNAFFLCPCTPTSCANGGTCSAITKQCTCVATETYASDCDTCTNPCLNGGTCTMDGGCACTESYIDDTCSTPCTCLNGGTCTTDGGCACTESYIDDTCSTLASFVLLTVYGPVDGPQGSGIIYISPLPTAASGYVFKKITLTTAANYPRQIAYDDVGKKIYWAEWQSPPKIRSCNIDGSDPKEFTGVTGNPWGLALDKTARRVYFSDYYMSGIYYVSMDFTGSATLVSGTASFAGELGELALGVDADGVISLYQVVTSGSKKGVWRVNKDDANLQLVSDVFAPAGIHVEGDTLWYSDVGGNFIGKKDDLDMATPTASANLFPSVSNPRGLAVYNNELYWVDFTNSELWKGPTAGAYQTASLVSATYDGSDTAAKTGPMKLHFHIYSAPEEPEEK